MAASTLPCGHENGILLKQLESKFNVGEIFKLHLYDILHDHKNKN